MAYEKRIEKCNNLLTSYENAILIKLQTTNIKGIADKEYEVIFRDNIKKFDLICSNHELYLQCNKLYKLNTLNWTGKEILCDIKNLEYEHNHYMKLYLNCTDTNYLNIIHSRHDKYVMSYNKYMNGMDSSNSRDLQNELLLMHDIFQSIHGHTCIIFESNLLITKASYAVWEANNKNEIAINAVNESLISYRRAEKIIKKFKKFNDHIQHNTLSLLTPHIEAVHLLLQQSTNFNDNIINNAIVGSY